MKIFISYRREDSIHQSGRIHEWLSRHFGQHNIFFDVDSIPPGVNWRSYLDEKVGQCDVLLAPIGDHWLRSMQERAADETDMVRIEIESAIKRGIPIIPLQVGNAGMPDARILPEPIRGLTNYQGVPIRPGQDFGSDMSRLIAALEKRFGKPPSSSSSNPIYLVDESANSAQSSGSTKSIATDTPEPISFWTATMKALPWAIGAFIGVSVFATSSRNTPELVLGFAVITALAVWLTKMVLNLETKALVRFTDRNAFINCVCEQAQKSHFTLSGRIPAFRLVSDEPNRLVFKHWVGRIIVTLHENSATIVGQSLSVKVISQKLRKLR